MIHVLIPVYNEAGNIANLAQELRPWSERSDIAIIFSDDGSTDATIALIREHFSAGNMTVIGDGINRGPGMAFNAGFEKILESAADDDVVVTMEADCTSDIGILPEMLGIAALGYDLVLASVYAQGGGFDKTTLWRRLLSSLANMCYRFAFDLRVATLSSFYRVYSVRKLREVKTRHGVIIREPGFICMLELLIKMIECKARVIEVPMMLASTKRVGSSKMKVFKTTLSYFRFLLARKLKGNRTA